MHAHIHIVCVCMYVLHLYTLCVRCVFVCVLCVYVCVVSVLAEAERVGQKCDRSAATGLAFGRLKICFLLGYKSIHTCEP